MYEEMVALLRKKYDKAPMVMEAASAIEDLSKQIKAVQCVNIGDLECDGNQLCACMGIVRKRLEAAAKQPRWIPVTERLPETRDSILGQKSSKVVVAFRFDDGTQGTDTAHTLNGEWVFEDHIIVVRRTVTHWMPLPSAPEPPKEDTP